MCLLRFSQAVLNSPPANRAVQLAMNVKCSLGVCHSDFAPPLLRIQAAHLASDVYVSHRQIGKARMLLLRALELFPLVTTHALDLEDQQHILSPLAKFVSILASATLEDTDEIDLALELLDEGRGIILGNLLWNDWNDVRNSELTMAFPSFCKEKDRQNNFD